MSGLVVGPNSALQQRNQELLAFWQRMNNWSFRPNLASASSINQVQKPLNEIQRTIAADQAPVPLVYGRAQVGGKPFVIDYDDTTGTWLVGYVVCYGEIESYQQVWLNGAAKTAGTTITYYYGTTVQGADPSLAAAIAGYADTMVVSHPVASLFGIAYIVVEYTDEDYSTWPEVIVEIEGKKVWNPKTSTTVYSENPALHLGDFIESPVYGMGRTVDPTLLEAAQDYCDDTTPGEARRTSFVVIDSVQRSEDVVELLRTYAGCFVSSRNGTYYTIPDEATNPVAYIGPADIVAGSVLITKKDVSDVPTVISAYYTDTTNDIWKERVCTAAKISGVDAGTVPWRESKIRLTGINRHTQANRECIERLNKLNLSDLEVRWRQFSNALEYEIGDVVEITTGYGLTDKKLRVASISQSEQGYWELIGVEYDPASYSDAVATAPTYTDGTLPSSIVPLPPSITSCVETVYQLANDEYASRIDIAWTAPSGSTVEGYNVLIKDGSTVIWTANTTQLSASTPPLKEGITYTVEVRSYNSVYSSSAAVDSEYIDGHTGTPNVPATLIGSNKDAIVFLKWSASTTPDVRKYEVRYYTTAQVWGDGTTLDVVDGLTFSTSSVAEGTWRFGVKAINSLGAESTTAVEQDVVVAADTGGVTIFFDASPPTANDYGDIWYDTDDDNHPYTWTAGSPDSWVSIRDGSIATAQATADNALINVITTVQTSSFNATTNNRYPVDTETNFPTEVVLTLPASPSAGNSVHFFDTNGFFDVSNLRIAQNATGEYIMGLNEDLYVDVRYFSGGLQYINATEGWVLI